MHLSRTNWHTKVYNRIFRRRSSTERRWASIWHWELPKKKQVGSLYKRIVYSVGIPNDSHLLVLIWCLPKRAPFGYGRTENVNWYGRPRTIQMGIQQVRAHRMNGNGRSYGRSAEALLWHVPYVQRQVYAFRSKVIQLWFGKESSNRNGLFFYNNNNNVESPIQHRTDSLVKQKVRNGCAVVVSDSEQ